MAFDVPTLDEMHEVLVALAQGLFPDLDFSVGSDGWLWLKTQAAGVTDNHAHVDATEADLMPDTAEGDMQARWGAIRGVVKKGATGARKADALRVFGTPAATVPKYPTSSELVHSSGLRFQITTADIIGPDGYVDVDVAAIDTGSATRLNAGELLTFASGAPAGLQEEAELQLDLDEDGEDEESPGAYRNRILSRFKNPPLGGAATDYVQWALEVIGVESAYCYPLRQGLGSVDLAFLHAGSGTARVPTAPEVAEVQAYIDEKRPVSVRAFRVLEVEASAVNVELLVTPDGQAANEFDWDDTAPPTVAAWTALTRTLQFSARPNSLKPGDRLVFKNPTTPGNSGRERVVESLGPGANECILEVDELGDTPAVGATIYSGGPLTQAVRAAIIGLFDGLGTANPDASRYGTWEGNFRPGGVYRVANAVSGVLDTELVTPVAVVEASDPVYPDDGAIGLLVYGRVIVRRAH